MTTLKRTHDYDDDNDDERFLPTTSGASNTHPPQRRYDSYRPNNLGKYEAGRQGLQGQQHSKRARHDTPHVEHIADKAPSSPSPPPRQTPTGIRHPPTTTTRLPKDFDKPLTCFFWSRGACTKVAESCIYAHWDTGNVAEPPIRVGKGGGVVAGPDAARAVGDALELRETLRERAEGLRRREVAVRERERRVEDREERVGERERLVDEDFARLRGRERRLR